MMSRLEENATGLVQEASLYHQAERRKFALRKATSRYWSPAKQGRSIVVQLFAKRTIFERIPAVPDERVFGKTVGWKEYGK